MPLVHNMITTYITFSRGRLHSHVGLYIVVVVVAAVVAVAVAVVAVVVAVAVAVAVLIQSIFRSTVVWAADKPMPN